jgi:hypothetical protein
LSADKLKSWTRRQLEYKSVITRGQIDGLVGYRNELYSQLQQTVEDIKVIEDLGRPSILVMTEPGSNTCGLVKWISARRSGRSTTKSIYFRPSLNPWSSNWPVAVPVILRWIDIWPNAGRRARSTLGESYGRTKAFSRRCGGSS